MTLCDLVTPCLTLCDLSHCLILCDLFSTCLTLWAVVRSFGGPSSKRRSSTLQPVFLSTTETCPGAGRPSRLPPLRCAALRRRGGVMGADLGACRPVRAAGGRHPGQPSTDHTAPGNLSVPATARRIWWSPFPGGGPARPRRALPPSRVVATGHCTRPLIIGFKTVRWRAYSVRWTG